MKKLIKLDFNNTTRERKTEDSLSELYSYDKNNGSFEFEVLNDTLTTEQVTALFKFTDSNKIWKTTGTIEGNKINVTFDTSLITQNETVICYLYFDEEQRTSDTFRFKFKVKVSEIDKMNRYEVKERFINNTVIVDRLDVVTKTELQEALKNVGVQSTSEAVTSTTSSEIRGTGMPNGVVEAPIGTTYVDTAKTNGALKWIKTTDGGNTGWKVAEGDTGWVLGWQADKGDNKNRMYFRRKNDVVHVKFEPKINSSSISPETNLILEITGYDSDDTLSIDGFKPVDDIVQTIYKTSNEIYSTTASAENSEGSQGTGVVIIQYEYNRVEKSGLKLQIVTSDLGVEQNHVNPFSYLTEDEWPVQLP